MEMQIKNQMDSIPHPLRWLKFKSLTMLRVDKDVKQMEFPHIASESVKLHNYFDKVWQFLV